MNLGSYSMNAEKLGMVATEISNRFPLSFHGDATSATPGTILIVYEITLMERYTNAPGEKITGNTMNCEGYYTWR
jgi:hypothetical protein